MKKKFYLTLMLLFFTLSSFAQNVPEKANIGNILDVIGIFSKMSDTLDLLKYRLADEESLFGFYLLKKIEIPFTMQKDTDYVILISTYDKQSLKIKMANSTDRITFASTEQQKVYMKYHSPVKKDIIMSIEANTEVPVITLVMIFCRDKNSIALPFDDVTATLRDMANSSECSGRKLSTNLPFFLVGGTVKSHNRIQYTLSDDFFGNNVGYGINSFSQDSQKNAGSDFYFALGKSKTVSDITAIVYRGNGVDFKKQSDNIIGFSHDFTKKGPYQLEAINNSPIAFEHGLLFWLAFDK